MTDSTTSHDTPERTLPGSTRHKTLYWLSRASIAIGAVVALHSYNLIKHGAHQFTPLLVAAAAMIGFGLYGKAYFSVYVPASDVRTGERMYWIFLVALFLFVFLSRRLFQ